MYLVFNTWSLLLEKALSLSATKLHLYIKNKDNRFTFHKRVIQRYLYCGNCSLKVVCGMTSADFDRFALVV